MTRKTQRMLRRYFPYACVLLIAVLIVAGVAVFARKAKPVEEPETSESELAVITVSETEETEETTPTIAAVDAVHVDALIGRYYEAKINDDAEELNNIVDAETEYDVADLADETQFISKYDNFKTYSLPGPTDDSFIVYVRYDIYFNGISTGAPALNHFIIMKDSEGYYYISDQPVSGEFEAYLEETENSDVVVSLKKEVEEELQEACDSNEDLKYLMQMLNGTSDDETESDSADAAGSEETVSDSESEAAESAASTESTTAGE